MPLAETRKDTNKEYISRASRPGHTTFSAELPHTFNITNLSSPMPEPQCSINFAIRNVDYQVYFLYLTRFSEYLSNDSRRDDIFVIVEMSNIKYNNRIFHIEIPLNVDKLYISNSIESYLLGEFDRKFFNDGNRLHNASRHIFDDFASLEYIYNIVSNAFVVFSSFYAPHIKRQIETSLPVPPEPRELYRERLPINGNKRETAVEFADRVWGDYISANRLYQKDIRKLDRPLYDALKQMSDVGKLSLHSYIRTVETRTAMRVTSCINELAAISNTDPDLNETILRNLNKLKKQIASNLIEGT